MSRSIRDRRPVSLREGDTGEPAGTWAAIMRLSSSLRVGGDRHHLPDRGPAAAPCPRRDAAAFRGQPGIVGHHLPDRGQATTAHGGDRHQHCPGAHVATPGRSVQNGHHLPDRGQAGYVARVAKPGPLATTPVNATRANGGTRGRRFGGNVAITCRVAAKRLLTRGPSPVPTSRRGGVLSRMASTCRIAARRLLTAGTSSAACRWHACRIAAKRHAHRRCLSCGRPAAWGHGRRPAPAGSRPGG
jgi:hypothetical protein